MYGSADIFFCVFPEDSVFITLQFVNLRDRIGSVSLTCVTEHGTRNPDPPDCVPDILRFLLYSNTDRLRKRIGELWSKNPPLEE